MEELRRRIAEYAVREKQLSKKFFYDHLKTVKAELKIHLSGNVNLMMKCIKSHDFEEMNKILSKCGK